MRLSAEVMLALKEVSSDFTVTVGKPKDNARGWIELSHPECDQMRTQVHLVSAADKRVVD